MRSLPILALLAACSPFADSSDDSGSGAVQANLIFVADNSASMSDASAALGFAFDRLVDELGGGEGLTLGITTLTAEAQGAVLRPGEAGTLVGEPPVLTVGEVPDLPEAFRARLFCEATCWPGECVGSETEGCVPWDPSYSCGDDPGGVVSWDYLRCLCGADWVPGDCGSGSEEGLEAVLLALCRAEGAPPDICLSHDGSPLTEADLGSNAGLVRSGAPTFAVLVSDEGDSSRLIPQGDSDPQACLDAWDQLSSPPTLAVLGPDFDDEAHTFACNPGGATTWGTVRYQGAAEATGGLYRPITEGEGEDCRHTDPASFMEAVAGLVVGGS